MGTPPRHMETSAASIPAGEPREGGVAPWTSSSQPLAFRNLTVAEPDLPLEPRRAVLELRRRRNPDPHQLGPEDGAQRRRDDHLLERAGAPARAHRPELRAHRPRRDDPVLARAREARPRARLQVRRPARVLGTAARRRRHPLREGLELDGRARADPRVRVRAHDDRRDRVHGRVLRAGRAARARGGRGRRRDPRLQRLPDHAVPLLGDQRPQGRVRRVAREPSALRRSRSCGRCGARSATTTTSSSRSARSTTTTRSSSGRRRATRSRSRCRCAGGSRRRASTASTSRPARRSRTRGTRPARSRSTTSSAATTR